MAVNVQAGADPRWSLISPEPYRLLIGGRLVPARDGAVFPSISPRDNQPVASIAQAGAADVAAAVAAARAAVDSGPWGRTSAKEREAALLRIADLVEGHADELAFLEAVDAGKPISLGPLLGSRDLPRFAPLLRRPRPARPAARRPRCPTPSVIHHELIEPLGVVAEILPWNGPLWTGVQRMAAILAAGNAAIIKPAQMASLTFMRLAELLLEADLPAGAINVLAGPGGIVGDALVEHPGVDMVSVTGGIETGSRVLEVAASQVKRVSLELGGKNPNLVFADADLDTAVFWSALGAFGNTGQICVCGSRILVERPIVERFTEALVAKAESMVVGEPLDPATELGPGDRRLARREDLGVHRDRQGRVHARHGRRALHRRAPLEGRLHPADDLHRRHADLPDRPRGDLRPGRGDRPLRHRGGGAGDRQRHPLRPVVGRSSPATSTGPGAWPGASRPARST